MNELTIGNIVSNAIQIGLRNFASVIGAIILWLLTLWIPYINVGTTIALVGMVVALSKGKIISPMEIFDAKYRKNMGEFFLLMAFLSIGITVGYLFIIIPGIVISLAWGQAIYLLIDKNMNPTEAISVSNKLTYGKKWTIFFGNFILGIVGYISILIIAFIFAAISNSLATIVTLLGFVVLLVIMMAASAFIYGELVEELENPVID